MIALHLRADTRWCNVGIVGRQWQSSLEVLASIDHCALPTLEIFRPTCKLSMKDRDNNLAITDLINGLKKQTE